MNSIISTNEPGQARLSPAQPAFSSTFDSAAPSELCQSQWCFLRLLVNTCGNMQGTEERGHQESPVSLEDTPSSSLAGCSVRVSQKSAGRIPLRGTCTCATRLVGNACGIKSITIEMINCLIYCKLVTPPGCAV